VCEERGKKKTRELRTLHEGRAIGRSILLGSESPTPPSLVTSKRVAGPFGCARESSTLTIRLMVLLPKILQGLILITPQLEDLPGTPALHLSKPRSDAMGERSGEDHRTSRRRMLLASRRASTAQMQTGASPTRSPRAAKVSPSQGQSAARLYGERSRCSPGP
jgi:hypothetical protein